MLKVESTFKLPKEFKSEGKAATLAQAIRVYEARSHFGLAKTKTRGEVDRTTKKLYKQKGTGGARHGARSAPIFVGGGTTFGPKPLERKLKLSDALRRKALAVALFTKEKEGKLVVVGGFSTLKSTKEMATFLAKLKSKRFTVAVSSENKEKTRFMRNIKGVKVMPFAGLNAFDITFGGILVLDRDVFGKAKAKTVKKEPKRRAGK